MKRLDRMQINMVRFCANECHNQRSGEKSVARMVEAYNEALLKRDCGDGITESFIQTLATVIDPANYNGRGSYRTTPVTFEDCGYAVAPQHIQRQMELLLENMETMTVDEFTKRFLEIHPFTDGNGRTAAIIYNFLNGDLDAPQPLPVYFGADA